MVQISNFVWVMMKQEHRKQFLIGGGGGGGGGGVRTKGTKLCQLKANIYPDKSSLKPQAFTG